MAEVFRGEKEAGQVATELDTRYEEIDLLYTIADILGRMRHDGCGGIAGKADGIGAASSRPAQRIVLRIG